MCSVVADNLQKLGFKNYATANDGIEAVSKLKSAVFTNQPFQVVLTDFWMVDMTGHQLLSECKADPELANTKVIFITAERNKNYVQEVLAKGADAYVFKPLTLDVLKNTLIEVHGRKPSDKKASTYQILSKTPEKETNPQFEPASETDLQLFLNTIPGFVLKITEDNQIKEFNHYLRATYNTDAKTIIDPDFIKSIFEIQSSHLSAELACRIAGETAHFLVTCQKYKNNTEAILIGAPITSFKRTEENLNLLNSKILSIEDMAASIAYKVNIPLLVIQTRITRLQKLLNRLDEDEHETTESLKKVEDAAIAIKTTVKSLKNLARESIKEPSKRVPLRKIMDDLSEIWKSKAVEAKIELFFPTVPEEILLECRENEIFLAILNLVQNALDAAAKQNDKWVRIDIMDRAKHIEIGITDSGTGIPLEVQYQLAKPKHQSRTSKSVDRSLDSGLGLAIAKGIIEDHQGTLVHDPSYPNTRFIVTLPIV
jgi:signal transduction histidine kinase/DNA-binding NarL/FixJ family response regulator